MAEIEPHELPTRWEVELEFVQSLSNIQYLNYLALNRYLEDEAFLNYLEYLEYWREPENAKYLVYPNCLHILTLLRNEEFRKQIKGMDITSTLMNDMVDRWKDIPQVVSGEGQKHKEIENTDQQRDDKEKKNSKEPQPLSENENTEINTINPPNQPKVLTGNVESSPGPRLSRTQSPMNESPTSEQA